MEWLDRFNNRRLPEPIGNIPPAEAGANVSAALEAGPMAAQPNAISLRQTRHGSVWIAAVHLAGTDTRRVKRALFGPFRGAVG